MQATSRQRGGKDSDDATLDRKRPRFARSRTGCLSCRRRKVKCDETQPQCIRCTAGGRECIWPDQQRPPGAHRIEIDPRRALDIPHPPTNVAHRRDTTPYHDLADTSLHRDDVPGFDASASDHASTSSVPPVYGTPLHEYDSPSPILQDPYVAQQYSGVPYMSDNSLSSPVESLHRAPPPPMQVRRFDSTALCPSDFRLRAYNPRHSHVPSAASFQQHGQYTTRPQESQNVPYDQFSTIPVGHSQPRVNTTIHTNSTLPQQNSWVDPSSASYAYNHHQAMPAYTLAAAPLPTPLPAAGYRPVQLPVQAGTADIHGSSNHYTWGYNTTTTHLPPIHTPQTYEQYNHSTSPEQKFPTGEGLSDERNEDNDRYPYSRSMH